MVKVTSEIDEKNLQSQVSRMREVLRILKQEYPDAECSLNFRTPFQLLIATILSAQCTDNRVNQVTPFLFEKFPSAKEMSCAPVEQLEELIRTTGFFRSKARALHEVSSSIMSSHGGEVPKTLEELTALRGVGRKTANVVLGNAFLVPGLVVDTHVKRLSYRLGFTQATVPEKIEREMMRWVDQDDWTLFSHLLIFHGRKICMARSPQCEICPIERLCPKIMG